MNSIKTKRLTLRNIQENDYEDMREYGCDEETGQYMMYWPKTEEQLKDFLLECVKNSNRNHLEKFEFAVVLDYESKVIGNVYVGFNENAAEIGWILNKSYWGNGYIPEAAKEVVDYVFKQTDKEIIKATCSAKNVASYRVMEKCGMKLISEELNAQVVKNGITLTFDKLTYEISKNSFGNQKS